MMLHAGALIFSRAYIAHDNAVVGAREQDGVRKTLPQFFDALNERNRFSKKTYAVWLHTGPRSFSS